MRTRVAMLCMGMVGATPLAGQFRAFGPDQGNCIGRNVVEGPQPGTYLFFGTERVSGQIPKDVFCLYLLDTLLQTVQVKLIEVPGNASPGMVQKLTSGGYALAGSWYNAQGKSTAWAAVLNGFLDTLWTLNLSDGFGNTSFKRVAETPGASLCWLGTRTSAGGSDNDIWVLQTNNMGQIQWNYYAGDTGNDVGQGLAWHPWGFWLVSGDMELNTYGNLALALDSLGQFMWQRYISDLNTNGNQSIIAHPTGDVFMVGESTTSSGPAFDLFLVRLSAGGQVKRFGYLGGAGTDAGFQMQWWRTDTLLVTGYTSSYAVSGPIAPFLLTMNMDFEQAALRWLPQPEVCIGQGLWLDEVEGQALVSGSLGQRHYVWKSPISGFETGHFAGNWVMGQLPLPAPKMSISPNPSAGLWCLPTSTSWREMECLDAQGRSVWQLSFPEHAPKCLTFPDNLPAGLYAIHLLDSQGNHLWDRVLLRR